jgi:hypothetical protein
MAWARRLSVRARTGRPAMIADIVAPLTPDCLDKSAAVQPRRASSSLKRSALITTSMSVLCLW